MQVMAFVAGPVVWLVGTLLAFFAVVAMYGTNPDSHFGVMLASYLGSGVGAIAAFVAMRKMRPAIGEWTAYLVVAVFALVWLGFSVVDAIGADNLTHRLGSLVAAQAAILMAWRLSL